LLARRKRKLLLRQHPVPSKPLLQQNKLLPRQSKLLPRQNRNLLVNK
jgi:hypothetical protein